MRSTASFTAAWVAGWRGLGDLLGDDQLAADPFGARFGGRWSRALALAGRRPPLRDRLVRLGPVANWVGYMQVRTRLFDDALHDFVTAGGRQIVILGAGYDCRAARFAIPLGAAGARVWEVDHPATQARKRAVLAELGAAPPVAYVTWDFERRPLAELPAELAAGGLDRAAATLVLWEGVTMYLSEAAIAATFAAVRGLGGPGTRLVFNYLARSTIDRPRGLERAASLVVRGLGEPFTWGWDPDGLAAWLTPRAWALAWNRSVDGAAGELLPREVARKVEAAGRYVALAEPRYS